jgi:hypothetical protein
LQLLFAVAVAFAVALQLLSLFAVAVALQLPLLFAAVVVLASLVVIP